MDVLLSNIWSPTYLPTRQARGRAAAGSELVDRTVQVAPVDDSGHQVACVGLLGEFAVEHAVLTDAQTTPWSMSGHWLDVEVRGIRPQRLECLPHPLVGLAVKALQVTDRARSELDVAQRVHHLRRPDFLLAGAIAQRLVRSAPRTHQRPRVI